MCVFSRAVIILLPSRSFSPSKALVLVSVCLWTCLTYSVIFFTLFFGLTFYWLILGFSAIFCFFPLFFPVSVPWPLYTLLHRLGLTVCFVFVFVLWCVASLLLPGMRCYLIFSPLCMICNNTYLPYVCVYICVCVCVCVCVC